VGRTGWESRDCGRSGLKQNSNNVSTCPLDSRRQCIERRFLKIQIRRRSEDPCCGVLAEACL